MFAIYAGTVFVFVLCNVRVTYTASVNNIIIKCCTEIAHCFNRRRDNTMYNTIIYIIIYTIPLFCVIEDRKYTTCITYT